VSNVDVVDFDLAVAVLNIDTVLNTVLTSVDRVVNTSVLVDLLVEYAVLNPDTNAVVVDFEVPKAVSKVDVVDCDVLTPVS
jgi:RIO-like serine/threonine protein kinase